LEEGKPYQAKYLGSVKAFTGVREVFETLANCGGRIALATDRKGPELKHYRSLLNVDDLIDAVACGDDVEHGKPDPRLVGLALRKLGIPAGFPSNRIPRSPWTGVRRPGKPL
jgi:phosphoglycolate phosphatase-like HAD superfamily hydrolase